MNVFEHEHAEKLRVREEAAEEVALGQAEGVSRKKGHADADRRAMTFCVSSGGTAHGDYGFSDDEAEEVSLVVDSVEDDLEGARQARAAELRKEAPLVSHSTEPTVESSSLPREDGISICRKRRSQNLRSRWLL